MTREPWVLRRSGSSLRNAWRCLVTFAALHARTARAHSYELEVYHINSYRSGPYPINMNTGDAVGDLFFDLKMVLMAPLTCADPRSYFHKDCQNKEVTSADLVVNKLRLLVHRPLGGYALCNVGLENNTDEFGHDCHNGTYCCLCGRPLEQRIAPCNATVGRENVKEHMQWPPRSFCNASAPDWMCWQTKLADKLSDLSPGWWYSTLDYGYCPHHPAGGPNCTWQVASVDKIINKTCHEESFFTAVEAHNRTCFEACGAARNVSSPCWTRCFYTAVLGPNAGRAGGKVSGIPIDKLVTAWLRPFQSEDVSKGGCRALPSRETVQPEVVV